ncbi:hypothetical protein [Paraburkholderia sp. GAS333]|uniref:hypothetical protein n=1 Tax=Paraburkholderia sp. GAS333 TaxID=3156279 RepID=UPI003D1A6DC2
MELAWKAGADNRLPKMTPAALAKWAHIAEDVAARFIRELRAEGPLRDTGERIGRTGRIAVYDFVPEWATNARTIALARDADKKSRRRRINHDANTPIKPANHDANTLITDGGNDDFATDANTLITTPSIYGVNKTKQTTPNKTSNGGAHDVITNGVDGDAQQRRVLQRAATEPCHHTLPRETLRSCSAQSERDASAASACGTGEPMPSETSNPRESDWPREMAKIAKLLSDADRADARCVAFACRLVGQNPAGLPGASYDRGVIAQRLPYLARIGVTDDEFEHAVTRARQRFEHPTWTGLTKYLCDEVAARVPDAREAERKGDKAFFDRPAALTTDAAGTHADAATVAADAIRRAQRTAAITRGTKATATQKT